MLTETVLTASTGGLQLWDPRTGTVFSSYKLTGGDCHPHALFIGNTSVKGGDSKAGAIYVAQADKAMMHVYQFEKDQAFLKFTLPEVGTAVAVSHSGIYCAMGTAAGRIYVWEVTSGTLLRVIDAHFKTVNVLRFIDDDTVLISGSADATAKVWLMGSVVAKDREEAPVPCHAWSDHALPITDIYCTSGGFAQARVFTVSQDHTGKIWSLSSGQLLLTLLFPVALHACCVHPSETIVLVGSQQGLIYQADLYRQRDEANAENVQELDWEPVGQDSITGSKSGGGVEGVALPGAKSGQTGKLFQGHSGTITGLAISMDGSLLISSSEDTTVKVWDVASRQLLRTFTQHKGPVTNVQILLKPDRVGTLMNQSVVSHQKLTSPPIRAFKRTQLVRNTTQYSHQGQQQQQQQQQQHYDQNGQATTMSSIDAIHTQASSIWTYLGDCKEDFDDFDKELEMECVDYADLRDEWLTRRQQAPDAQQQLRDRAEQLQRELHRIQQHHTRVRQLQDELYQGAVSTFLNNRKMQAEALSTNQASDISDAKPDTMDSDQTMSEADTTIDATTTPVSSASHDQKDKTGSTVRTRRQRATQQQ